MENLKGVLNDFYYLFNIPVKYIDNNLNEILNKGHNENYSFYLNKLNILESCKEVKGQYIKLNYDKICFLIFNSSFENNLNGYFIIGPFTTNKNNENEDIKFKSENSIKYIVHTFKSLIRDNLNKSNTYSEYITKTIDYLHKNYSRDICIDEVCSMLNINKSYFCSLFKKETGLTFCNFLNKLRIEMSKIFLYNKKYSIMDVSLSVGYNNHNYYSTLFKKLNGTTPLEFRNNLFIEKKDLKAI